NGDVVNFEARNGGRDQMPNGCRGLAAGAGAGANHHRRRRLLLTSSEVADVGHHDVNSCGSNTADLLDRATDLTFKGPYTGDFLHEGGQTERADIVEKLVARIRAVGQ